MSGHTSLPPFPAEQTPHVFVFFNIDLFKAFRVMVLQEVLPLGFPLLFSQGLIQVRHPGQELHSGDTVHHLEETEAWRDG